MDNRVRAAKTKSKPKFKSKLMTSTQAWSTLFGQPQLLHGDDPVAYREFLDALRAAVKPIDTIEKMLVDEIAFLEWEVLRWRRLKLGLIRACELKALEPFVDRNLDYNLYSDYFADDLAKALEDKLGEDRADFARSLAHRCARNESDAVKEVEKIFPRPAPKEPWDFGLLSVETPKPNMYSIRSDACSRKTSELMRDYMRGKPDALNFIRGLLTCTGKSMEDLMANAVVEKLEDIERIDHLTAIAESRRNASLREIDRRRAVLGDALRRSVQAVEDAEYEVIEPGAATGKEAA